MLTITNVSGQPFQIDVIGAGLPDAAAAGREGLLRARELVQLTLDDTRSLSRLLRPQILDDLGLESALRWLARSIEGLAVELDLAEPMPEINDEISTLIFRVCQEALSNASRHSAATRVKVALNLHANGQWIRLEIDDNGRGCDLSRALSAGREGHGGGLGGMRDRIDLFDGRLDLQSAPGKGFRISIELPLRSAMRNDP